MQFLRTFFWAVFAVIMTAFAVRNWVPVSIILWSDIALETKLPVLLFTAFLLGWLPMMLWHRVTAWFMRRKLDKVEAALVQEQIHRPAPDTTETTDNFESGDGDDDLTPVPGSTPMAVPPGVV